MCESETNSSRWTDVAENLVVASVMVLALALLVDCGLRIGGRERTERCIKNNEHPVDTCLKLNSGDGVFGLGGRCVCSGEP